MCDELAETRAVLAEARAERAEARAEKAEARAERAEARAEMAEARAERAEARAERAEARSEQREPKTDKTNAAKAKVRTNGVNGSVEPNEADSVSLKNIENGVKRILSILQGMKRIQQPTVVQPVFDTLQCLPVFTNIDDLQAYDDLAKANSQVLEASIKACAGPRAFLRSVCSDYSIWSQMKYKDFVHYKYLHQMMLSIYASDVPARQAIVIKELKDFFNRAGDRHKTKIARREMRRQVKSPSFVSVNSPADFVRARLHEQTTPSELVDVKIEAEEDYEDESTDMIFSVEDPTLNSSAEASTMNSSTMDPSCPLAKKECMDESFRENNPDLFQDMVE